MNINFASSWCDCVCVSGFSLSAMLDRTNAGSSMWCHQSAIGGEWEECKNVWFFVYTLYITSKHTYTPSDDDDDDDNAACYQSEMYSGIHTNDTAAKCIVLQN